METMVIKENGLQILDQREAGLIALAEQYKDLRINGVDDKEGYKKVRQARIELKNARVAVENDAKALRENAIKFQKTVIAREKELVSITLGTEESLQGEEDRYNEAIETLKIEEEKKEKARIQNRIVALAKFNYALDLYEVTTMTDDKFNELLTQVEIDYNKEQERIANEKAETERMRNEEAARLKAEREEIERIRKENEARTRELLRQEEERIAAEKKRLDELLAEGERIKKEREQFEKEKQRHEEAIKLEQAKKEAAERARIEEQSRIKREAEEKAERERLAKIEAERQESLKPDKQRIIKFANQLTHVPFPGGEYQEESKELLMWIDTELKKLSEQIVIRANKL